MRVGVPKLVVITTRWGKSKHFRTQKLELSGNYRKINFKPELINLIYGWLKANNSKRSFTAFAGKHPDVKPILLCRLLIIMTELNIIEPCQPEEATLAVVPVTNLAELKQMAQHFTEKILPALKALGIYE